MKCQYLIFIPEVSSWECSGWAAQIWTLSSEITSWSRTTLCRTVCHVTKLTFSFYGGCMQNLLESRSISTVIGWRLNESHNNNCKFLSVSSYITGCWILSMWDLHLGELVVDIPYVQPIIQLLKQCLFRVLIQSIKKVKSTSLKKKNPNQTERKKKKKCFHCTVLVTCGQFLMLFIGIQRRFSQCNHPNCLTSALLTQNSERDKSISPSTLRSILK